MPLTIRPKIDNDKVPIEAEVLCPNELAGKTVDQICQLTVHHGNRQRTIGECFDVHGDASDGHHYSASTNSWRLGQGDWCDTCFDSWLLQRLRWRRSRPHQPHA